MVCIETVKQFLVCFNAVQELFHSLYTSAHGECTANVEWGLYCCGLPEVIPMPSCSTIKQSEIWAPVGLCHSGVARVPGLFHILPCTTLVLALFMNQGLIMPPPLGARGIMFSGCPSICLSVQSPKYPLSNCSWVRWSIQPTVTVLRHVRLSVRPSGEVSVCRRMHGGNSLKFCMLMYCDHLQNWLVHGYGLLIFSCDQAAIWLVQSVCLSVRHTFFTMFPSLYHHEIFRSYYQWQKWRPCKRSRSEVKGQGHRGHDPT